MLDTLTDCYTRDVSLRILIACFNSYLSHYRQLRSSTHHRALPLPIRNRLLLILIRIIRIIDHEIKEAHFILNPLNLMHLLDQKRNVANSQLPPETVPDDADAQDAGEVSLAYVLAVRVRRPDALARRRGFVKEAEFAVEEEIGETRS